MKKIFKILSLLLYVTLLSSCISSTIPNKLKMAQGKAFYTTCNIWYEKPARIFSTNYHKGRMITAGTKVTINSIKKGMINFTVNETGVPFTLILVRKHSTITLKEYFERYFSEQNVMDYPNGLFHKFSKIEQENIQNGNLESGMSRKAVLMAFGYPPSHKTRSLEKDIWYYWTNKFQKISVHWKNDKLVKIKGGRRADEGSTHFIPDKPGKHPKSDKQAIVVAVTDFENLVGQKEHNWLRVGIPELMTTYFSKIKGIKIIERSIIEKDLSKESPLTKDIASGIGKQVGATYIILGSYKTRGKEITVNTRMLKTESGKILRAEQETGKLSETDSVVGALILKIAGVMGRTISNAEKRLLKVQGTNMMKVIEGLSKGQLARNRGDLDGARKYYQDALKNDPTNKSILQHIKDIDVELKSIAIVDFKNNSKDAGFDHLSNAVPEELTTLMIHKTALSFTERLNIEKAIEELKLGKTEKIDKNTAPKVGRLAGATQLMIGSFSVIGKNITINTRLIDTETGSIIGSKNVSGLLKNIQALEEKLVDQLISRLNEVRVVEMMPPKKTATKTEAEKVIKKAKKAFQNAKEADAQDISPTMYNYVKKLIAQADKAFANKNYNDAREKAYKGEAKARELEFFAKKEKSRSKIDEFKKSLNKEARTVELTLEESIVGFEYNRDNLKESSLSILSDIAEILKEFSEYRIVIVGHTDSKGTNEYNQKLSERRAQSVLKYMSNQGVKSKRMTIIGYGEDRPIAKNTTPEGRAKNRRVEFRLLR